MVSSLPKFVISVTFTDNNFHYFSHACNSGSTQARTVGSGSENVLQHRLHQVCGMSIKFNIFSLFFSKIREILNSHNVKKSAINSGFIEVRAVKFASSRGFSEMADVMV